MVSFFKKLLSNSDEVSSKRFISLYALLLLTAVLIAMGQGKVYSDGVIIALCSLVLGSAVVTVLNKSKNEGDVNKWEKPD